MSTHFPACAQCGADFLANARFCPRYGQTVAATPAVPPPPPPRATAPPHLPAAPPAIPPPPPPYRAPATRSSNLTPLILVIVGVVLLGIVAVAGIAAWMTFGQQTVTTVTTPTAPLSAPAAGETTEPAAPSDNSTKLQPAPVKHAASAKAKAKKHSKLVTSADQATALVMARPDVKAWSALIDRARAEGKKRRALTTVETEPEGDYVVHVFESVEDEEPGHTATFGWFRVNHKTGAITNETPGAD